MSLRDAVWSSESAELAVEVNQRALIDKVLARYSGAYTVYRELLQNADDATASTVEIRFRSDSKEQASSSTQVPDLSTTNVKSIVARNDGIVFRDEDWNRLRKIAEGNPDESKIGAFGVGFYSLFSICEEPIVSSGQKVILFHWKNGGDQLFVRSGNNPNHERDVTQEGKPWTSFTIDLRDPNPMPDPESFSKFLATSLAFTVNIRNIKLYFDDHCLLKLQKLQSPTNAMKSSPKVENKSPSGRFNLQNIDQSSVQINAQVMRILSQTMKEKEKTLPKLFNGPSLGKMLSNFFGGSSSSSSSSPKSSSTPTPSSSDKSNDPLDLLKIDTVSLFLRVVSGHASVSMSRQFITEIERATKKPPPKKTTVQLIYTNKQDFDATHADKNSSSIEGKNNPSSPSYPSSSSLENARHVFDNLLSNLDKQGNIFIGFATHQTTGCAAPIAARFIPTVERESIDFQHPHVADWNKDLLWLSGALARIIYESELESCAKAWAALPNLLSNKKEGHNEEETQKLNQLKHEIIANATHVMRFFSFTSSHPSTLVSDGIQDTFFRSTRGNDLAIISSKGPLPANKVRLPNPSLEAFVKDIPVLPKHVSDNVSSELMQKLRERGILRDISVDDILNELSHRPLNPTEMKACLHWWIAASKETSYQSTIVSNHFLQQALLIIPSDYSSSSSSSSSPSSNTNGPDQIIPLGEIRYFLNQKMIPANVPLPRSTLPVMISEAFTANALTNTFNWHQLPLFQWISHLLSPNLTSAKSDPETNLLVNPKFAEKVLTIISRAWSNLSPQEQHDIKHMMIDKPCIPTKQGLQKPPSAYSVNVQLFDDIPIVSLPSGAPVKGSMVKLLDDLGVRKHVELQLVFERMLVNGTWSHIDLARYLASIDSMLTTEERKRLTETSWLLKADDKLAASNPEKKPRYRAQELFVPSHELKELGLPLIDWSGARWVPNSPEAKFLQSCGLKKSPSAQELLKLAQDESDQTRRTKALHYFLDNFENYKSDYDPGRHNYAFIPSNRDGKRCLLKPGEVYSNPACSVMGFPVLEKAYAHESYKFKIASDPPAHFVVQGLTSKPPQSITEAKQIFAYLSTRVGEFRSTQISTLMSSKFVPIMGKSSVGKSSEKLTYVVPSQCYFSASEGSIALQFQSLFVFIDFGLESRPFLMACGTKDEPSIAEIAQELVNDPNRFYSLTKTPQEYLGLMRSIAVNSSSLPTPLRRKMKTAVFLLASRKSQSSSLKKNKQTLMDDDDEEEEEEEGITEFALKSPEDVIIVDDANAHTTFGHALFFCPQEDVLEMFAESLGSPRLSKLIKHDYMYGKLSSSVSPRFNGMARLIHERTTLFLHERQHENKHDIRHDAEWLKSRLRLIETSKLQSRRTLKYKNVAEESTLFVSAAIMRSNSGTVDLYLASNTEIDYFEIASDLCKILLVRQRLNDALLFETVLQTSLKNLKKRGFSVDRILNARKAEREAQEKLEKQRMLRYEEEQKGKEKEKGKQAPPPENDNALPKDPPPYQEQEGSVETNKRSSIEKPSLPGQFPDDKPPTLPPKTPTPGFFSNIRDRMSRNSIEQNRGQSSSTSTGADTGATPSSSGTSDPAPTPMENIRAGVQKAVNMSKGDKSRMISSKTHEEKNVTESQGTYCDPSGASDLHYVGDISGLRFYVANTFSNPELTLVPQLKNNAERFVTRIVLPLGKILRLDVKSLHIFYDVEPSRLIAFNRNGALFCNLRYYIAWHDMDVMQGNIGEALISWYMSLCHEVAHNLVQDHNSQHEFWFSSLAESYFTEVARLL